LLAGGSNDKFVEAREDIPRLFEVPGAVIYKVMDQGIRKLAIRKIANKMEDKPLLEINLGQYR